MTQKHFASVWWRVILFCFIFMTTVWWGIIFLIFFSSSSTAAPSFLKYTLFYFFPYCVAWRILVPLPGIESALREVEEQSPNHWTTREAPIFPSRRKLSQTGDCTYWRLQSQKDCAGSTSLTLYWWVKVTLKEMGIPRPPDRPLEKSVCRTGSNG